MFKSLFSNNQGNATQDAFAQSLEAASNIAVAPVKPAENEPTYPLATDQIVTTLRKWAHMHREALAYVGPVEAELTNKAVEMSRDSARIRSDVTRREVAFYEANGGMHAMSQLVRSGIEIPGFADHKATQHAATIKAQLLEDESKRLTEQSSKAKAHATALKDAAALLAAVRAAF